VESYRNDEKNLFALNEILALTLDVQYLDDKYKEGAGNNVDGWITRIWVTAGF
jgi:hypothetical protein